MSQEAPPRRRPASRALPETRPGSAAGRGVAGPGGHNQARVPRQLRRNPRHIPSPTGHRQLVQPVDDDHYGPLGRGRCEPFLEVDDEVGVVTGYRRFGFARSAGEFSADAVQQRVAVRRCGRGADVSRDDNSARAIVRFCDGRPRDSGYERGLAGAAFTVQHKRPRGATAKVAASTCHLVGATGEECHALLVEARCARPSASRKVSSSPGSADEATGVRVLPQSWP